MSPSSALLDRIGEQLSTRCNATVRVDRCTEVGGGSINDAYRLETAEGSFFLKVNRADRYPSFFEAEADGLGRLAGTRTVRTPEVIGFGEVDEDTYLLLEYIAPAKPSVAFRERLGAELAAMHRGTNARFGLERDNYIGTLVQRNTPMDDWTEFLVQTRLEPMVRMARDKRKLEAGALFRFERLYNLLPGLFPKEPPALLHGDLWGGNFMADTEGGAVLIDPAVYYGHREMDLAMMRLFDGPDPVLQAAYEAAWPLQPGWEDRVDLCNLYPLLVHVNLFGGRYTAQVDAVLKRFV